jgi:hypothetical protein
MQTIFNIMKKGSILLFVISMALVVASCSGSNNSKASKKLEETKQNTTLSLSKIKIDIEGRISYIDQELEKATGDVHEKLTAARAELVAQKDVLDTELEKIAKATLDTWNDVVKQASDATAKAKSKTNEVSKNVRAMLDAV